jgi:hypothetical protein
MTAYGLVVHRSSIMPSLLKWSWKSDIWLVPEHPGLWQCHCLARPLRIQHLGAVFHIPTRGGHGQLKPPSIGQPARVSNFYSVDLHPLAQPAPRIPRAAPALFLKPQHQGTLDLRAGLCYIQGMSDTLTVRVPTREKVAWQQLADSLGEDLSEFARKAVRQRVQAVQARQGSPWDDLLGSVRTDAPPATNPNVRRAMRSTRG